MCAGKPLKLKPQDGTDYALIARQELQLLRSSREVELPQEARLSGWKPIEKTGKTGRPHGIQRPCRVGVVHQTVECLLQHRSAVRIIVNDQHGAHMVLRS